MTRMSEADVAAHMQKLATKRRVAQEAPRAVKVSSNTTPAPRVAFKALPENNGSHLEQAALQIIRTSNLPDPTREHKFHPTRKWRFDFAWIELKLALEVEGGLYGKSRHTSITGYTNDCEKYSFAALLGWRVLRCTVIHLKNGELRTWLRIAEGL